MKLLELHKYSAVSSSEPRFDLSGGMKSVAERSLAGDCLGGMKSVADKLLSSSKSFAVKSSIFTDSGIARGLKSSADSARSTDISRNFQERKEIWWDI